jgi:hypothetical protein
MGAGCRSLLAQRVDIRLRFLSIPGDSCLVRDRHPMRGAMRQESTKIDKTRKRVKARCCSGFAIPCPVRPRGSRIADCGLRITDPGSRITDPGLRIADPELPIADCGSAAPAIARRPAGSVQPKKRAGKPALPDHGEID